MNDRNEILEGSLAAVSLVMGELTGAFLLFPALYGLSTHERVLITAGFGLYMAAAYFIVGLPLVSGLQSMIRSLWRMCCVTRTTRTEES